MLPMTVVFAGLGTGFQLNPLATTLAGLVLLTMMFVAPYYLKRFHGDRLQQLLRR